MLLWNIHGLSWVWGEQRVDCDLELWIICNRSVKVSDSQLFFIRKIKIKAVEAAFS